MGQIQLNDPAYVQDQYRDGANLDARIALHARFSTAVQKFPAWVFDHLVLPTDARVLELGCGTGALWRERENRVRTPATWCITLSDFSWGMVETTRAAGVAANFLQSDAQVIPFCDENFDAVIANHMLYHVPDRSVALAEMARVLKPDGKLFAATNGEAHLREYFQLVGEFLKNDLSFETKQFTLENGAEQLAQSFTRVQCFDFADRLVVTEVEPLIAYALSGFLGAQWIGKARVEALRQFVAERIARDGAFHITKAVGLFVAEK